MIIGYLYYTEWQCDSINGSFECIFREDNNARNGIREKKQRKAKTNVGEIHHYTVYTSGYDGTSKQGGVAWTSISQRDLSSDVLKMACTDKPVSHNAMGVGYGYVDTHNLYKCMWCHTRAICPSEAEWNSNTFSVEHRMYNS